MISKRYPLDIRWEIPLGVPNTIRTQIDECLKANAELLPPVISQMKLKYAAFLGVLQVEPGPMRYDVYRIDLRNTEEDGPIWERSWWPAEELRARIIDAIVRMALAIHISSIGRTMAWMCYAATNPDGADKLDRLRAYQSYFIPEIEDSLAALMEETVDEVWFRRIGKQYETLWEDAGILISFPTRWDRKWPEMDGATLPRRAYE